MRYLIDDMYISLCKLTYDIGNMKSFKIYSILQQQVLQLDKMFNYKYKRYASRVTFKNEFPGRT